MREKPEFKGMRSEWKVSRVSEIKLLSRSLTQKRRKMTVISRVK